MSDIVQLAPSVEFGEVAEECDTSSVFIKRILRTIVWRGLARPVIRFLEEEEARYLEMRARRGRR